VLNTALPQDSASMIAEILGFQGLGFLQGSAERQSGINGNGTVQSSFRAGVGHSKASQLEKGKQRSHKEKLQ